MKTLFLVLLTFVFIPLSAHAESAFLNVDGPILILGDSMTKGDLGRYLHAGLQAKTGQDILSIGLGGAGSYTYTLVPMTNLCCGYTIRKSVGSGKIKILENAEDKAGETVGEAYHGNLSKIIAAFKPAAVLIVLGTNQVDAHGDLIELIREQAPDAVIAWAGPPLLSTSAKIYKKLSKALGPLEPPVQLIHCENFQGLGDPNLTMVHYGGKTAAKFATDIISQLK